jgi:hypothetical protein
MRKPSKVMSFMHWCLPIPTFGSGYFVSQMTLAWNGNHQIGKLFGAIIIVLTLAALSHDVTYKEYKTSSSPGRLTAIILLIYVFPFAAGFCMGFFLS